jgi:hypothetical protein
MKNITPGKFRTFFCLLACVAGLVSCSKSDSDSLEIVGDVVVQDKETDSETEYGMYVYVTSNLEIADATVTTPGTSGKTYQLTLTSNKYGAYYNPTDYSATMPTEGDYTIKVTSSSGESAETTDIVGDEKLTHISITSASVSSGTLSVTWNKVINANAYAVRILSSDK